MVEVLVLVAAAVLAAGIYSLLARRRRETDAARAYLQGFRYILSDEPDAALEQLTRAVEVDARTLETYFALGALFRRTGEHERAVRLHQNMLLKADLAPRLRLQIELELALDYQRAGMLERAAEIYEKVTESDPGWREALLRLRQVYEEQRNFPRAAETQARLVEKCDGSRSILAHLLAEAALAEKDSGLAARFAERAVAVDAESGHASFALGTVRLGQGKAKEAAAALKRCCELEPELAPRAAEPLVEALGSGRAVSFFQARLSASEHPATRVALARCLRHAGKVEEATAQLRRALDLDPRYVEARLTLGRALLGSSMGDEARRELERLLAAFSTQEPGFACRTCGHGYGELQFRCTRCLNWDTVRRIAGAAAEEC
ncbi:MAG: tetratricopeptide repeat protein [Myxococcales bacterium]|jgi:lipopolysaccharide biosynthesis regulator YciM